MRPPTPSYVLEQRVPTEQEILDHLAATAIAWLSPSEDDDRSDRDRQVDFMSTTHFLMEFRRLKE